MRVICWINDLVPGGNVVFSNDWYTLRQSRFLLSGSIASVRTRVWSRSSRTPRSSLLTIAIRRSGDLPLRSYSGRAASIYRTRDDAKSPDGETREATLELLKVELSARADHVVPRS